LRPDTRDHAATRAPSLIHNWVSLAGIVLAASSFFAVACLIALDLFRGFANPYMGILTYIVAPGFLIAGLLLIAAGALWERRRRRTRRPGVIPEYPHVDFNVPRERNAFVAVVVVTVVFFLSTAVGSYRTYQFTESVAFCGETCHSIMQPEYTAYQQSPHARVRCVQCHIGPGANWYVKSKLSGAYQVYAALANRYPRPIPTPIENLRPARETCEQCHWPRQFFGATQRTFQHYLPDERNSPWTIQMLLKVGGGDPAFGAVGGIHWHMAIANKIEYIAGDARREVIPWVRLTDAAGHVTVYESSDGRLKPEQIAAAQPRVMDCIDCHNRPAHIYRAPVDAVDLALQTGRIDRVIPDIKARAVEALTGRYASADSAGRAITETLTAFYESSHPAFMEAHAPLVSGAVAETKRIYAQGFFPAMKVDWRTYPDHAGHMNAPGCFRCHDGDHTSSDGRTITHDCNACHAIIAQGPSDSLETSVAGLEFRHPVDISGAWKEMNCSGCHDGSLAQ
jgi:NapC/NirT cytochrome c family, N-terminal region